MIDNEYRNAFKEVFDILENTEEELRNKVPIKFIQFLESNMNKQYETNIQVDIEIDKQVLLKETEAILSLIYRSYWATEVEKLEFIKKDKQELIENEQKQKQQYKDINEIFEQRRNINKIALDNNLMIISKESFIKKILKKIISFFRT